MHGVRLVKTPAVNNNGSATSGRPDSVLAIFEKSITVEKAIERERDTERMALFSVISAVVSTSRIDEKRKNICER